jgi:glycosyltransferase involved in cell wall biosynthesis
VRASGGCVAAPTLAGATEAARWLAEITAEPEALRALGERARALAVERFDIERIGSQFEEILAEAAGHARVRRGAPVLAAAGGSEGGMR